jgi:hypothetical protein
VDMVDRERCETKDERGIARDSVRGVRRAMFNAIVWPLCQILLIGWPKPLDMASEELAAQTGGRVRRLSMKGGISVSYSKI